MDEGGAARGRGHQRHDRHGSGGELAAGPKQRGDNGRKESGVESVVGGKIRELSISHGLRNQDQRNRHAGEKV